VSSLASAEDVVVFKQKWMFGKRIIKMKVVIVMIEWDSVTGRNFRIHCHLLSKCS